MDDTVISSRIRLARNIKGLPFTSRMTPEQKKAVCTTVKGVVTSLPGYNFDYLDMENVTPVQAGSLVEEHLISPEFANNREGSGLLLDRKNKISIMINEEDHLRIQVIGRGEKLKELYRKASAIDDACDKELHFAFSEELGYLTRCPTNLGTAMRASVMMHLPVLHESGLINKVINTVSQVGITLRGLYGEGTEPTGCLYQVSNQMTMGISEEETIEHLYNIIRQIANNEASLREKFLENIKVEDRIFRSYGILKQARLLTSQEFMKYISDIRLGVEGGLLNLDYKALDDLFIKVQPYSLMLFGGEEMDTAKRDIKRAENVRSCLA